MPWGLHLARRLPRTEMDQTRIVFAGPSTRLHRRRSVRRGIPGASAQAAKPSSRKPTRSRGSRLLVATHCRCISRQDCTHRITYPKIHQGHGPCGIDQIERLSLHSVPAILFQTINPGGAWYRAMSVCAFVRIALSFSPSAFTSPRSRRHWALSMAGGGGGRNWLDLSNTKVCILPREGEAIIPVHGGPYMPVPGTGV